MSPRANNSKVASKASGRAVVNDSPVDCQSREVTEGKFSAEVLETDNHAELVRVQQDIITIQEAVLALHKAQQQGTVSETDYEIKIASYSQQMDELQKRHRELKATVGRFAEVK